MNTKISKQRRAKRGQLMIMVVVGGVAMGNGSVAWAGFFDACVQNPPGTIQVTQNTIVQNEMATLSTAPCCSPTSCSIEVADGVTLEFKNVRVNVSGDAPDARLAFNGEANSRLIIGNSKLDACDEDVFGFSAGVRIDHSEFIEPAGANCDIMELYPDGDLEIISSTLSTIYSMDLAPVNKVTIEKSTLKAPDVAFGVYGDIFIGAGFPSDSLHTLVDKTDLTAGKDIEITAQQDTTVTKNDFQAGGNITITGNPCTSQSNSPNVPCQ